MVKNSLHNYVPSNKNISILQINSHASSDTSTGKQVIGLQSFYQNHGLNSFVASSDLKKIDNHYFYYGSFIDRYLSALLTRFFANRYGRGNFSTSKLLKIIKKIEPDVVQIHCINSYDVNIYRLFSFLKKKGIPTLITEHAEFFHTGNCSHAYDCSQYVKGCHKCKNKFFSLKSHVFGSVNWYWKKMKKAFFKFEKCKIVCVSPWLSKRASLSDVLNGVSVSTIFNGVDTNVFRYRQEITRKNDSVLFVTSDSKTSNKGINYLIDLAELNSAFSYTVVGCNKEVVNRKKIPDNVLFLGKIINQDVLSKLYQSSSLTVVLSKIETFSMIVSESLCCGTPVVGFLSGGPESICLNEYCSFVDYGNVNKLFLSICEMLSKKISHENIALLAKKEYSFDTIGVKYLDIIKNLGLKKEEVMK